MVVVSADCAKILHAYCQSVEIGDLQSPLSHTPNMEGLKASNWPLPN